MGDGARPLTEFGYFPASNAVSGRTAVPPRAPLRVPLNTRTAAGKAAAGADGLDSGHPDIEQMFDASNDTGPPNLVNPSGSTSIDALASAMARATEVGRAPERRSS